MKTLRGLLLMLLLGAASDAIAQDVRYNFDRDANFSAFKTYKWVDIKGAQPLNDLVDRQIKDAVDAELARKGLTRTDADTADLYVGYQAAISTEKAYTSYDSGWGYGPGWYGSGTGTATGQTSTIYAGQLVLDMYATSAKALVFRSVASKAIETQAKPEKRHKDLEKAVAKMLKGYPPAANKRCPPDCKN